MGARLLPRRKYSNEGDQNREGVARGNEKFHREAAGLQRALDREIRIVNWHCAAAVARSGRGICPSVREALKRFQLSFGGVRRQIPAVIRELRLQFFAGIVLLVVASEPKAGAQTQYSIGYPSPEQQYMLELINRARSDGGLEATRLGLSGLQEGPPNINGESFTIANTAQPLSWNPLLANCAQNHAKFLNDNDQFFTGTSPHTFGGLTPEQRINAAGYPMNLAMEYNGPTTSSGFFPGPENVAENETIGSAPLLERRCSTRSCSSTTDCSPTRLFPGAVIA